MKVVCSRRLMSHHPFLRIRFAGTTAIALLATCSAYGDDVPSDPSCSLHLAVELTPDVPNVRDGGFLSSLLGDHPGYRLTLQSEIDDTHLILQLTGPGTPDACENVVDSMRDDGRVLSIDSS
jgi:hypothetical protein